ASGLSAPIGFKNGTSGDVQIACDAVSSSSHPHRFVGVTSQGLAAIVRTKGNPYCHIILRGGKTGTNFDAASVTRTGEVMEKAGAAPNVLVDCSHANSSTGVRKQARGAATLGGQSAAGQACLIGTMSGRHLVAGRQDPNDPGDLVYGQSITGASMSWDA